MSGKICGCISTYNNAKQLEKCLESMENFVDYIIVVDGPYEGHGTEPRSIDETQLIVTSFRKRNIFIGNSTGKPYPDEMFKRNLYFIDTLVDEGDWCFIIDDDEYIASGIEETKQFLEQSKEPYHSYSRWNRCATCKSGSWKKQGEFVRLIKYIPGMKYTKNHYTIETSKGKGIPLHATVAPLHIAHEPGKRDKEYLKLKQTYNKKIRPLKEKA